MLILSPWKARESQEDLEPRSCAAPSGLSSLVGRSAAPAAPPAARHQRRLPFQALGSPSFPLLCCRTYPSRKGGLNTTLISFCAAVIYFFWKLSTAFVPFAGWAAVLAAFAKARLASCRCGCSFCCWCCWCCCWRGLEICVPLSLLGLRWFVWLMTFEVCPVGFARPICTHFTLYFPHDIRVRPHCCLAAHVIRCVRVPPQPVSKRSV